MASASVFLMSWVPCIVWPSWLALFLYLLTIVKPYFRKLLSKSVVILAGLALFQELARVLEVAVNFGSGLASDLDSMSGISTSIINSGEGSLKIALIGLAKYWVLSVIPEATTIATVLTNLELIALIWNLEGRQI